MYDHTATPSSSTSSTETVTTSTSTLSPLVTGDVIELDLPDATISALVLLATDQALILDACDGSTPFVVKRDELGPHRRFNPAD